MRLLLLVLGMLALSICALLLFGLVIAGHLEAQGPNCARSETRLFFTGKTHIAAKVCVERRASP